MLKCRGKFDLASEALDRHFGGKLLRQDLDHYVPAKRVVAREEHSGHSAAAQLTLDGVDSPEKFLKLVLERSVSHEKRRIYRSGGSLRYSVLCLQQKSPALRDTVLIMLSGLGPPGETCRADCQMNSMGQAAATARVATLNAAPNRWISADDV
jgi:hypothetical protein